jgi:hypothetical protein
MFGSPEALVPQKSTGTNLDLDTLGIALPHSTMFAGSSEGIR